MRKGLFIRVSSLALTAATYLLPLPAVAGIDDWVRQCRQDDNASWCEQQGLRIAATSHAEAAAAFNIGSGFARLFAAEYGTVMPGSRPRPGTAPGRRTAELSRADQDRVRTAEGLRQYLYEHAGKGNPHDDFLFAGAAKGADRARWMQQAATAGDADAMYVAGYLYANGLDGVRRDDTQAYLWFGKAAQAGNAAAMGVQARMLAARGGSVPEAMRLAGAGCDKGAQSACIALADLSLKASDGDNVMPEEKTRLVEQALKLYSDVLLHESKGFSLEPERQAALYALAKLYAQGKYIPPNKVEARDDLVRALKVDGALMTDAWKEYADALLAGPDGIYGFGADAKSAVDILQRFADMGDVGATLTLGTLLLGGRDGVSADPLAGLTLLKSAAGDGDTLAMLAMANYFAKDGNDKEALKWVRQAVAAGDPAAYFLAADYYRKGRGTPADETAFRGAMQKSCDLGYTRACFEIGNRMLQGSDGYAVDIAGGTALLERARREGSGDASCALGMTKLHAASLDNDAQLQEALQLLVEAGQRGNKQATDFLAGVAGGSNAVLQAALARAKGEPVPVQLSVQEQAMRQLAPPAAP